MTHSQDITEKSNDVEAKILEAATTVFIQKGLAGTSMQEIADEACISRTSLHYYYRNKDKLFDAVFESVVNSFINQLVWIINADMPVALKLERFVDGYLDFMLDNPGYVNFMIHDLNTTPERMVKLIIGRNLDIEKFKLQIISEMKNNQQSDFDVAQFWASLIGICIMPFIFKPMVNTFFLDNNEASFRAFIHKRKQHILDFLMKYIHN